MLKCEQCGKKFQHPRDMEVHSENSERNGFCYQKGMPCPLCGRDDFADEKAFRSHYNMSKKKGRCGKRLETKDYSGYVVTGSLECQKCGKKFLSDVYLKTHVRRSKKRGGCELRTPGYEMSIDKENLKCLKCNKKFSMLSTLRQHARVSFRAGSCPQRGVIYPFEENIDRVNKKCLLCDKKYKTISGLMHHAAASHKRGFCLHRGYKRRDGHLETSTDHKRWLALDGSPIRLDEIENYWT